MASARVKTAYFERMLNLLPVGENMKVFVGTVLICGLGTGMTLTRSGVGYDSMEEKRADKKKKAEAAERQAALDRIAAANAKA